MKTLICIQFLFTSFILADDNLWDKMKSKAEEYLPFDKEEIWECRITANITNVYRINIKNPSVAYRDKGSWIEYEKIEYDKKNKNIKVNYLTTFDLLLKKKHYGADEYLCEVIG